jgi:hypothetical protein
MRWLDKIVPGDLVSFVTARLALPALATVFKQLLSDSPYSDVVCDRVLHTLLGSTSPGEIIINSSLVYSDALSPVGRSWSNSRGS